MNFYEFNLLVTSDFSDEKIASFTKDLASEIKEFGEIVGEVDFKQKKLAYSINKQDEAWLTVFIISLKGDNKKEALANIEKILKEKKEILRYLVLAKKELVEKVKAKRRSIENRDAGKKVAPKEEKIAPTEENLEKINEKVEELLKEE